nr:serine/threonine-protein kinase [Streptomyces sp. TRM68416]
MAERIGSGGMGTVWRAHDELVGREVAVKQPRLPGDPEDEVHQRAARRLHREARAAARVDHPSAVSIHDVVEEDDQPWIVMELVRGESLHELLKRGPLEPAEAARIGLAVLGALRAAHAVGIVHRDVKPANVLLGRHRRVVLTDFGIAHVQGEDSLTATGEFVGSLEFVAPERMSGRGAGPASDLWSLGVLLYAAVEGWSPFRRTAVESTLAAILTADLPAPKQAGPLGPLLVRLLEKDPAQRPEPDEVAAALEAAAGETREEAPEVQDPSGLQEFGDDIRTVRLGGQQAGVEVDPEADTLPAAAPPATEPEPIPVVRRPLHRRPAPLALVGALLAGTAWLGASALTGPDGGADTKDASTKDATNTATGRSAAPKPTPSATASPTATATIADGWTVRTEKDMGAALALPAAYEEFSRSGGENFPPRMVEYADPDGYVEVRLTQWDNAPGTPLSQAEEHARTWKVYGNARSRHTETGFRGWEAVRSDSTYGDPELRRRVVELFVRTDHNRLYELRVEMPEGGAAEKEGMAVFQRVRDGLNITAD